MAMNSMTAYASTEQLQDDLQLQVEVRTVNSRYLDISLRLPHGYAALEEKVKARIKAALTRGRVEVRIHIRDTSEVASAYAVDTAAVAAYRAALEELKAASGCADPIRLDHLLASAGMIKPVEVEINLDRVWEPLQQILDTTLSDLNRMRQVEGTHLAEDLEARLCFIEDQLAAIETVAADGPRWFRDRLHERLAMLQNGSDAVDPDRLAMEVAILADKCDISEELVRARSHIAQFRAIMSGDAAAGRKLNFLLQEVNREFNTIGSKIGRAEAAHSVVDVKAELEKMREQVQNIE